MFKLKFIKDKTIKQMIKDYWVYYILAMFLYGGAGVIANILKINYELLSIALVLMMIVPLFWLWINVLFYNQLNPKKVLK